MDDDKNILAKAAGGSASGRPRSRNALVSFVLANIALGSIFLPFVFPSLMGIAFLYFVFPGAIVFGHLARREIRKNPGKIEGEGMALYGIFAGYFCLCGALFALYAVIRAASAG